jgi:hypothetical protein
MALKKPTGRQKLYRHLSKKKVNQHYEKPLAVFTKAMFTEFPEKHKESIFSEKEGGPSDISESTFDSIIDFIMDEMNPAKMFIKDKVTKRRKRAN